MPAKKEELLSTASSYCATRGILVVSPSSSSSPHHYIPAPYSLHPTSFSRSAFERVQSLSFNAVCHSVASDYVWLREAVKAAAEGDADFTGRLVALADEVMTEGRRQSVVLGILRSDYMLHSPSNDISTATPIQVELNTIASSFGCLSTKISQMHRHLNSQRNMVDDIPVNNAANMLSKGLATAFEEYVKHNNGGKRGNCRVVMVVQPGETNTCDQRDLEFLLGEKYGVPLVRKTLLELSRGSYGSNNDLLLKDEDGDVITASVVYYRAGYTPENYPTEEEWKGRYMAEKSIAVKCPDVFYQLVGTKKIQQVLAEPGVLSRFTPHHESLSATFTGLYSLGENDESVVQQALAHPEDYVLKPQREGGGNNLYNDELKDALSKMSARERGGYILMQKIISPHVDGILVRNGTDVVYEGKCICEMGVFGVSVRRYGEGEEDVVMDDVGGYILRSKSVGTDEGGVAAGYAFLSSPALV